MRWLEEPERAGGILPASVGIYVGMVKRRSTIDDTGRGLMRAAWTSDQTFGFIRDGFELTPEERATAVNQLRVDLARCGSAPGVASC
jgi:hypothetical protein